MGWYDAGVIKDNLLSWSFIHTACNTDEWPIKELLIPDAMRSAFIFDSQGMHSCQSKIMLYLYACRDLSALLIDIACLARGCAGNRPRWCSPSTLRTLAEKTGSNAKKTRTILPKEVREIILSNKNVDVHVLLYQRGLPLPGVSEERKTEGFFLLIEKQRKRSRFDTEERVFCSQRRQFCLTQFVQIRVKENLHIEVICRWEKSEYFTFCWRAVWLEEI